MAREVVWTDPAWEDLETAAEYIARDSEAYAAAFVEEIKAAATSLSEMAERGQIVPEMGDASIRELLVRPYRLVSVRLGVEPHPDLLLPPGVGGCLLGRTHRTPWGGEEKAWIRVNALEQIAGSHSLAAAAHRHVIRIPADPESWRPRRILVVRRS